MAATRAKSVRTTQTHTTPTRTKLARTNLTLPQALMSEVDELAGPRGRSRYVAEAVAARVKRDKLGKAIRDSAGIFVGTQYQMNRDEVTAWIDFLRTEETD